MSRPHAASVSLLISQPNLGKTLFVLERLCARQTCLVLPSDEHETFQTEFSSFFKTQSLFELVDESDLTKALQQKTFENVVFFSFQSWNDNDAMHLNSIAALARLAVERHVNVWASVEATSARELGLIQQAILKISEKCDSAMFEEVNLAEGLGLLFHFTAKQFYRY